MTSKGRSPTELQELTWLARQTLPVWGGPLERGVSAEHQASKDEALSRLWDEGLVTPVTDPKPGWVITHKGRRRIDKMLGREGAMTDDLREAVARALWCVNEDEKTFDEALRSEIDGDKQDANALCYVREMADAAIAVVVERCAALGGIYFHFNGDGEPSGEYCTVDTGEPNTHKYISAEGIRAMARKEGNHTYSPDVIAGGTDCRECGKPFEAHKEGEG